MKVGYGFASVLSVIDDEAIAGGGDAQFGGDHWGGEEHFSEQIGVGGLGFSDASDGASGND